MAKSLPHGEAPEAALRPTLCALSDRKFDCLLPAIGL